MRILNCLDRLFAGKPTVLIGFFAVLLVLVLVVIDYLTGTEISFSIFYLLPIALASWYGGKNNGLVLCVVSSLAWLAADLGDGMHYSSQLIPYWNALVRLGFFVLTCSLLSSVRNLMAREEKLARTDPLTGLLNGRAFREKAGILFGLARRHQRPLALAYIDLDNFKTVNDTRGHNEGDQALTAVAAALKSGLRKTDLAARLGGDEFAVMLPETDAEGARVLFKKVREELAGAVRAGGWPIGYSIGVVTFSKAAVHFEEALKEADRLMYRVKKEGKNQTYFAAL